MKYLDIYSTYKNRIFAACVWLILLIPLSAATQTVGDTLISSPTIDTSAIYPVEEASDAGETPIRLSDTVYFRSVPDSAVNRLKSSPDFEYANNPEYWVEEKEKESDSKGIGYLFEWLFTNPGVRMLMYLVLAAVLVYTVYKIVINNNLFYSASKKVKIAENFGEAEMMDDELDDKIGNAVSGKDYRNAVRFLYIKTLRNLNTRGWIQYHLQGTNYDYLNQVSNRSIAPDFGFLTQVYEYSWYGGFELSETQFETIYNNFKSLNKTITD